MNKRMKKKTLKRKLLSGLINSFPFNNDKQGYYIGIDASFGKPILIDSYDKNFNFAVLGESGIGRGFNLTFKKNDQAGCKNAEDSKAI